MQKPKEFIMLVLKKVLLLLKNHKSQFNKYMLKKSNKNIRFKINEDSYLIIIYKFNWVI